MRTQKPLNKVTAFFHLKSKVNAKDEVISVVNTLMLFKEHSSAKRQNW